jgi:rhamnogalacturonan lyase-like protein/VCBS repeat protein
MEIPPGGFGLMYPSYGGPEVPFRKPCVWQFLSGKIQGVLLSFTWGLRNLKKKSEKAGLTPASGARRVCPSAFFAASVRGSGFFNSSFICLVLLGAFALLPAVAPAADWPQYDANPFVISLGVPGPEDSAGGVLAADLNGDGCPDYLVTVPGHIAAYANDGAKLWILKVDVRVGNSSERVGLPGHNGPGVQVGDVDGDGAAEVLFLTQDSVVHCVDGVTGAEHWRATPPLPERAERWEHLVIANFRGKGDRDLLLQTTNKDGYRMGHMLAAYALKSLKARKKPLWTRDDFLACAHNGARVADLDGDGRDEILGGTLLGPDGKHLTRVALRGHIDSIFVYDVRPDLPGLEVVALEEGGTTKKAGGNRVFLFNPKKTLWESHYKHWEPQNAAVGEFDPKRPGLEVWARSRFNKHQKPFVFDAQGAVIAHYEMDAVAPEGWSTAGVEVIWAIDWTGEARQYAAAKERHTSGKVGVFDPITGAFLEAFQEKADRLYVADVSGDWREELVVLNGNELHIYHNGAPNPRPDQPRLWTRPHYRRSKMTYNYYSP